MRVRLRRRSSVSKTWVENGGGKRRYFVINIRMTDHCARLLMTQFPGESAGIGIVVLRSSMSASAYSSPQQVGEMDCYNM